MIANQYKNSKPNLQVEDVGAGPLWWSSERVASGALPVYTGRGLGFVIVPKSVRVTQ